MERKTLDRELLEKNLDVVYKKHKDWFDNNNLSQREGRNSRPEYYLAFTLGYEPAKYEVLYNIPEEIKKDIENAFLTSTK